MEAMAEELASEGVTIQVVGVHAFSGIGDEAKLLNVSTFPMFQDDEVGTGYAAMAGERQDGWVYTADGRLFTYMRGREPQWDMETDEGWANVKQGLVDAFDESLWPERLERP